MTEQDIIGLRRSYYSHVTLIDDPIRRIIGCLEKRGLLENTVIVFTADHGEQNGDYGLLFKQTFLETSDDPDRYTGSCGDREKASLLL